MPLVSVPYKITLLSNFLLVFTYVKQFQYLMKLHYSQTSLFSFSAFLPFQYLMKLHYSQTLHRLYLYHRGVSVPYEITLLSNMYYDFTELVKFQYLMKLHYSQTALGQPRETSMFQYLMKLHYSQTRNRVCGRNDSFSTL